VSTAFARHCQQLSTLVAEAGAGTVQATAS
jgi:hypothetical protein